MMDVLKGHNMTTRTKKTARADINTAAVYDAAEVYTASVLKNDKDTSTMLNVLIEAGVPETHLISPIQGPNKHNSTSTPEWFNGLKAAIESKYSPQVHALMAMEKRAAGNTYIGENNRDGWMRKANSIIGGMRTAYINRLKRQGDIVSGKGSEPRRRKTPEDKFQRSLKDAIGHAQKAETFKSRIDLDVMVRTLGEYIKATG